MPWPTVSAGQNMLASQYNALSSAMQLWPGPVDGGGYALTDLGSLGINGAAVIGGALTVTGAATLSGAATVAGNVSIANGATAPRQQLSVGAHLDLYSGAVSGTLSQASIRADTANSIIVSGISTGAVFLNYDGGSGGVFFGNGSGASGASVSSAGKGTFVGVGSNAAITGTLGGWTNWSPNMTVGGGLALSGNVITDAQYLTLGPLTFVKIFGSFTVSTAGSYVYVTCPVAAVGSNSEMALSLIGTAAGFAICLPGTNQFQFLLPNGSNFATGTYTFVFSGFYRTT